MIIDSRLEIKEALAQNPTNYAPDDVLQAIGLMTVRYIGFDGKMHAGQMAVADSVMADVDAFFQRALELEFPIEKVVPAAHPDYKWDDEKLMGGNVSSGFNFRVIAGTDKISKHGRGLAFDINPRQNPYIRYEKSKRIVRPTGAKWDRSAPGTLHAEHPLAMMMEGFGWEWGGKWTPDSGRVDYQHFEKNS